MVHSLKKIGELAVEAGGDDASELFRTQVCHKEEGDAARLVYLRTRQGYAMVSAGTTPTVS